MERPSSIQSIRFLETNTKQSLNLSAQIGLVRLRTELLSLRRVDGIEKVLDAGVVLVTSMWDDHYAIMLWLDSTYPTNSTAPGSKRGSCATTSGVPTEVESQQASAHVIFSDIKFGPLGSTTGGVAPAKSALNCAEMVRTWLSAKYWLTVQCLGRAARGELPAGGQETAALTCRVGPAGDSLHYCPPWVLPVAAVFVPLAVRQVQQLPRWPTTVPLVNNCPAGRAAVQQLPRRFNNKNCPFLRRSGHLDHRGQVQTQMPPHAELQQWLCAMALRRSAMSSARS